MNELFTHVLIVLVPLLITSVLHMAVVKKDRLANLKIPIWQKGFGENKTWRGVFFVPATNGLFTFSICSLFGLHAVSPFLLGFTLGLSYLAFELPNSFLKRSVGIEPGGHHPKHKYLFYMLDKTDSAFGVTLTYSLITGITREMDDQFTSIDLSL